MNEAKQIQEAAEPPVSKAGWAQRELDRVADEVRLLPRYLRLCSEAYVKAKRGS